MFSLAEDTTAILERNGLKVTLRCGRCRGTGNSNLEWKAGQCPVCKGKGRHRLVLESQTSLLLNCGYCRATGTQYRDGREPLCPVCRGLGAGELHHPAYQCNRCAGSGHERDSQEPCTQCRGWGALGG